MEINKLFICGSGFMGSGIAQVSAAAGYEVQIMDISETALKKATESISWSLSKMVQKGKVKEDVETIMSRISTTDSLEKASDADMVIEVVVEDLGVKKEVFAKLDALSKKEKLIPVKLDRKYSIHGLDAENIKLIPSS